MNRIAIVGAACLLALLAACTSAPINNIQNAPIAGTHTADQVRQAILAGGAAKGWTMQETKPGVVHGVLKVRGHEAAVDVPYSTTSYSIEYVSSLNLDYKDGKIHRNYNKWIGNLNEAIQAQLSKL